MKLFNLSDKACRRKFKSEFRLRTENSFDTYQSDSGSLYIEDKEEGLTFEREKVGDDKYNLAVIIEEDNADYAPYEWSAPETPFGFQLLEEISLNEFNRLARDYLRHKLESKDKFKKWLHEKLYKPLHDDMRKNNYWIESMPAPGASKKEWKSFDRAMATEDWRQQKDESKAIRIKSPGNNPEV